MTEKQNLINNVLADMESLTTDERNKLRFSLCYRLGDYDLHATETLPAISTFDNDNIMKQFSIGKLAEGCEKSSVKNYLYIVKAFFKETGLLWSSVTGDDVATYLATRKFRDNVSDGYINNIQKALCSFYGWMYKHKHIERDLRDEIPISKATQKRKVRLSDDEVEACRRVAEDGFERALLELMLSTGLRVGEICDLKVQDLDFQKQTISVYAEKTNQWRTAYMTIPCKMYLSQYLANRVSGPVFLSRKRTGMCTSTIERAARRIALKAGCSISATVHVYRKTFASVMYRKTNGDVLLISKLLGHAKIDTTIKYYLVEDMDEIRHTVLRSF